MCSKRCILLLLSIAYLLPSALVVSAAEADRPAKPNVVLILTDDLGWQDVKCCDVDEPLPMETPNIDVFTKKGVMFWLGYSPTPTDPLYCSMVEEMDYYIGGIFDCLDETDDPRWPEHSLSENTFVIFTSDNGGAEGSVKDTDNEPLAEGKKSALEGGTRVPLHIAGPGVASGVQTDVMANGLDFYPTVLAMTKTPKPAQKNLDGCDLLPLLLTDPKDAQWVKHADGTPGDTMVWHCPHNGALESTIRVGDYKLVRNYDHVSKPKTSSSTAEKSERPNIVVFVADDMGWGDSGTYGHKLIKTPNLDKLASRGVKLTQCYSACAVCSPSRSAILTGRHPYRNGVWRHLSGKHPAHLRASEITYPKLLQSIGYETCHVGKWHLNSLPQFNTTEFPQPGDHGYDYWMTTHNNAHPSHKNPDNFVRNGQPIGEQQGYSAQIVANEATHWLREKRDKTKPFALSVWVHEPHSPIATDPRFANLYGDHDNRTYMGNISQLDAAVGEVMQTLSHEGVGDNTLFIFTSDNGPVAKFGGTTGGLRGGKRSDHEGGIRVPGIVSWPGRIAPGTTSSIPVVGTDIFTTVLNITGISVPSDRTIDGVNMLPALDGKPVERAIPLFWRTHVSQPSDRVAMRIGDWKIVGNDTLTKFQLYEIEKDWKEENDLAASMPGKTEEMKQQLLKLWDQIKTEGPNEWWEAERSKPKGDGMLSY